MAWHGELIQTRFYNLRGPGFLSLPGIFELTRNVLGC